MKEIANEKKWEGKKFPHAKTPLKNPTYVTHRIFRVYSRPAINYPASMGSMVAGSCVSISRNQCGKLVTALV